MNAPSTPAEVSTFEDGDLYDLVLGDLDYGVDFYVGLARAAQGPVLDICCGTGRILLPCLQAGVEVDGLDLFEGMLKRLRTKAAAFHLNPQLYQADMNNFELPRRYALIMITFNAFIHNMTQEAQIRCLERCRQHLLPGGLLAFDTFFPGLEIVGAPQNTRVLELEKPHPATGLPLRMYDTRSFDRVAQTQRSVNELELLDAQGNVQSVHRSTTVSRYIYKEEMALLLRVAGFPRWEICGGFDRRPLTQETDAMIVLAWRDREG
jgi:SAM-dependent methyltransferase